jgi:hypothetical protein
MFAINWTNRLGETEAVIAQTPPRVGLVVAPIEQVPFIGRHISAHHLPLQWSKVCPVCVHRSKVATSLCMMLPETLQP